MLINILVPSEKDSLHGSRCIRSFFTIKIFMLLTPINKLYVRPVFLTHVLPVKSVTGVYVTFIDTNIYLSKIIVHFILKSSVSDTQRYTNDFNSFGTWVLSIHLVLSFSLHFPLDTFGTFLVTVKSSSNFLKYLIRLFTSVVRFIFVGAKLA